MPWNLILVHSALFFIYVMVYIAMLTSSLTLVGKLGPMEMNLWLVTAPAAGYLLFGFTFRRFSCKQFLRRLAASLGLTGVAIVALALGVTGRAGSLCLGAGLLFFVLGTGYIYGYLHYLMCRWLPPGRLGICIGLGFALPSLLQFLTDWLLKVLAAPPLFLWVLLLAILSLMAMLLLRTESWGLEEQPVAPRPLIARNLPLLCCISMAMGLLVGLNDTINLVRYDEYVDYHFLSRVYSAIGFLLAGWLADHYPMWLPLTALLSKSVVLGFHVLALEGYPLWISVCGDAFFSASLGLFVIWLFLTVARHTRRPELWAGMGRVAELPAAGLAGLLGSTLLQSFPFSVTLLVYVGVILLAVGLFYRCFLLYSDTLLKSRSPILLPHFENNAATLFATPVLANTGNNASAVANTGSDVATIANAIPPSITAPPPLADAKYATAAKGNAEGATIVADATEANANVNVAEDKTESKNAETVTAEKFETEIVETVPPENFETEIAETVAPEKLEGEIAETVAPGKLETEIAETVAPEKLEGEITETIPPEKSELQNAESLSVQNANEERTKKEATDEIPSVTSEKSALTAAQEEKLHGYKTFYDLSVRETEVLGAVLQNISINQIAETLFISPRTVKFHISSILRKTGANSQRGLKHMLEEHDKVFNHN